MLNAQVDVSFIFLIFLDVSTSQSKFAKSTNEQSTAINGNNELFRNDHSCSTASHVTSVTTQTEPIVQSSPKLQSIYAQSASTTCSSTSSSTTTTKSTKSSGATSKPQIKFSPDIEQYFKDSKSNPSPSKHGHKRKERKHKR